MLSVVPAPTTTTASDVARISGTIQQVMTEMGDVLIEREEQTRLMWTCLIARHHMVQVGGAGSAKSLLTSEMIRRIGPAADGTPVAHFFASLHPLMKEEELFGGTDFRALKEDGIYRHHLDGMMPEAMVVTLDEVFNASGSILKTMMRVLNERQYKNGPDLLSTPLMSCFGTANQLPSDPTLAALWDRFLGRIETLDLSEAGRVVFQQRRRARKAALQTPPTTLVSLDDIIALQNLVPDVSISAGIDELLLKIWTEVGRQGISLSTRRMSWCEELLQANALLNGRMEVNEDDLIILQHCLWNRLQEREVIRRLLASCVSPLLAKIRDIADMLNSSYNEWKAFKGSATDTAKMAMETQGKFKEQVAEIKSIRDEAVGSGKAVAQVQRVYDGIKTQMEEINRAIVANPF